MATTLSHRTLSPMKLRFYAERYRKEKMTVQETFVLTTRTKPLTGKFYAKHDVLSLSDVKADAIQLIKRQTEMIPKDIYSFRPPTVNMEYGWFSVPLVPVTKDPRLRFSRKQSDFIVNELVRRKMQKGLPNERFAGVQFRI